MQTGKQALTGCIYAGPCQMISTVEGKRWQTISEIILILSFLVNPQMEEVINGTFVWIKFLKRC